MKLNFFRGILIILLLFTFSTIFGFSSQDGETSGSLSQKITIEITKNVKSIQKLESSKKEIILKKIEHIIRKLAHFSLYTVVGILLMALFSTYKLKEKNKILYSFFIGLFYALTDEFHQLFSEGRTAQITDVIIDSMGVAFGILIVIFTIKLFEKYINKMDFKEIFKNVRKKLKYN